MRLREIALLAVLLAPFAIASRWYISQDGKGAAFLPSPDAGEYAAAAQSVAQDGQFLLQVGPHRVRPRYPPGWPLLLAAALGAGVDGESLWRVTALFGAALSVFIACCTTIALRWLRAEQGVGETEPRAKLAWLTSLAPGLMAGVAWALSPLAATIGGTLMSDEPTALTCLVALGCAAAVLVGPPRQREGWLLAGGGLAAGQALTMRAVEGLLLAPPIAILALHAIRRRGVAWLARRAAITAFFALAPVAATAAILIRSGQSGWKWSAYEFWAPERFGDLRITFDWAYAWIANPHITTVMGGEKISQLRAYALTYLGWSMPSGWIRFGSIWPTFGWLALVCLFSSSWLGRLAGAGPQAAEVDSKKAVPRARIVCVVAITFWCVSHWLVFGSYFYPDPRFVLSALVWSPVALGAVVGLALGSRSPRVRVRAAAAFAVLALLPVGDAWTHRAKRILYPSRPAETRASVAQWLSWSESDRRDREIPFDPVSAQALGLLPRRVTEGIHEWGRLPPTKQVGLLRRNGYLNDKESSDQNR